MGNCRNKSLEDMNELEKEFASLNVDATRPDKLCHKPNKKWTQINSQCFKNRVEPLPLNTPIFPDKIRIVCVSDTHSRHDDMMYPIPNADILIHAGDFSKSGTNGQIEEFNQFLGSLVNIKHKIVIAGNHELQFDPRLNDNKSRRDKAKSRLKNCIYLEDESVSLMGLNIYGSPWQPIHCGNAFQKNREDLLDFWKKIPDNTDILVTHGPPLGYGDVVHGTDHVGCVDLLNTIKYRVKPKYNIFGHIHEDYGIWTDNTTTFINASICNSHYKPVKSPILIDIDLPPGVTK